MGDAFYSKSAYLDKEAARKSQEDASKAKLKVQIVERAVEKEYCVFFLGEMGELSVFGKSLGINVLDGSKLYLDSSLLMSTRALVLNNVHPGMKIFHMVSMAVNYGVPVIWAHKQLFPYKWAVSFSALFVGDAACNVGRVWNEIMCTLR